MGFAAGVTPLTFNHYVKSLRKLGVPFAHGEIGTGSGKPVRYSFNHMMELSLALTLRIYGTLPDPVLEGLMRFRHDLYALYRRAYLEYATGLGAPVQVTAKDRATFEMSGVYLDLHIRFGGGRAFEFGPPRLLSPFEALRVFARLDTPGRAHLPLNLSLLAIGLVECAETCTAASPRAAATFTLTPGEVRRTSRGAGMEFPRRPVRRRLLPLTQQSVI